MPDCTLDRLYKPRSKMDHGARELERGQTVIFLRGTHVLLACGGYWHRRQQVLSETRSVVITV